MSKSRPKKLFSSVITVGSLLCPVSSPSRMHIGASPFALDSKKHAGLNSNQVQCRDFETVKDGREEHSATENFPVDPITSVVQASPDVLASHRLNGAHRAVSSSVVPVQTVFKRLKRDLDINCNDILAANSLQPKQYNEVQLPQGERYNFTPNPSTRLCFRCLSPNHLIRECRSDIRFIYCFIYGHRARNCFRRRAHLKLKWAAKPSLQPSSTVQ